MAYGLYIHIPYCRSRCRYCDFYTAAVGGGVPGTYIDALLRDFARFAPRDANGAPVRPATVYFGGGTPGLLLPGQVARILEAVNPAPGAEVTLETNPGLTGADVLRGYYSAGVNRLSLGVQSARDASLRTLGRIHTAAAARRALADAGDAGFVNITGDIMLALPGYTVAEFDETLALLKQGGTKHISAYLLKLEPGTPFGDTPPASLPDDDAAADFYLYAVAALAAAGFAQYEISNFAQPGYEGQHNLLYWQGGEWLGLGPAAHSNLAGRRFSLGRDTEAFLAGALAPTDEGSATAEDYAMLRLRLVAGLDEAEYMGRYGKVLTSQQQALLQQYEAAGYARRTPGGWALTPRGMLVQNSILAALFA